MARSSRRKAGVGEPIKTGGKEHHNQQGRQPQAEASPQRPAEPVTASNQTPDSAALATLAERVKRARKPADRENAFRQIVNVLKPRIKNLCSRFTISGCTYEDVYQLALIALYEKAIKDFDRTRGMFDRFALLCIRRALSTSRKTGFQNRTRLWNSYVSLDQERSDGGDELSLVNIVPQTKGTVLTLVESREFFSSFRDRLYQKLSRFEAEVFTLFLKRHTYEEIAEIIRARTPKGSGRFKGVDEVKVKGVDNALTRTKHKAKRILKTMVEKDGLPESVAIRLRRELFGDDEAAGGGEG